jgi:hypothetical protein
MNLTAIGSPQTAIIDGVQWEKNVDINHNGPGWRFGSENLGPIAVNGASIVAVIKMGDTRTVSNNWDSVVDVFYDRLVLGVRNDNGLVNVRANGSLVFAPTGTELAEGQKAVLSMVAQPDGTYRVWVNGSEVMTGTAQDPADMTALTPGTETYKHYINVGSNDPDRWTAFNGYIGDVFLYQVALSDAKRQALESKLMTKFTIDPTIYTIQASVATPGGTISPKGTVKVPAGTNKTFTITPDVLYEIDKVVVDGVDQGPISTYTFVNVRNSSHTIVAYFRSVPSQTVYGKVTDGTEGVHPAKVYFSLVAGAPANALFTAKTTDLDGNYAIRIPQGTWYAAASADGYTTSPDKYPVAVGGTPVEANFQLVKLASTLQPMLVSKGSGASRADLAGTVGYAFTTGPNAIDVTALGFVDWERDGLQAEHQVGIWQVSDHGLVAAVTVPAGTAGTLNGDHRYKTLDMPVRLEANTTYVVGGQVFPSGDLWPNAAASPGLGQPDFVGIAGLEARSYTTDASFAEPTAVMASPAVCAAVNLIGKAVPVADREGNREGLVRQAHPERHRPGRRSRHRRAGVRHGCCRKVPDHGCSGQHFRGNLRRRRRLRRQHPVHRHQRRRRHPCRQGHRPHGKTGNRRHPEWRLRGRDRRLVHLQPAGGRQHQRRVAGMVRRLRRQVHPRSGQLLDLAAAGTPHRSRQRLQRLLQGLHRRFRYGVVPDGGLPQRQRGRTQRLDIRRNRI